MLKNFVAFCYGAGKIGNKVKTDETKRGMYARKTKYRQRVSENEPGVRLTQVSFFPIFCGKVPAHLTKNIGGH
jgi:hypothetical protein